MIPFCANAVTFVSGLVWGQGQRVGPFVPRALCTALQLMVALSQAAGPETCSPTDGQRKKGELCRRWSNLRRCYELASVFQSVCVCVCVGNKKMRRTSILSSPLLSHFLPFHPLLFRPSSVSSALLYSFYFSLFYSSVFLLVFSSPVLWRTFQTSRCSWGGWTWSLGVGGRRHAAVCLKRAPQHLAERLLTLSLPPAAGENIFTSVCAKGGERIYHTWLC